MNKSLEASTVRILYQEKENYLSVGAGVLISEKLLVTCAHVVADALLGVSATPSEAPSDTILLDFPLIAPLMILTAKVINWIPEEDITVLELETSLPDSTKPTCLICVDDLDYLVEHPFQAFGFPAAHPEGISIDGTIQGKDARGRIQMTGVNRLGFFIEQGFSGTPIWDSQAKGVVGIAASTVKSSDKKVAFMIPVSTLVKACPFLEQHSNDGVEDYLEKLSKRLSYVPRYCPPFNHIRQRVKVSQKRLRFDPKEETQVRENKHKFRYFATDEKDQSEYIKSKRVYKRRGEEMYREQQREEQTTIVDWEELRGEIERGVILGDPGYGKSWLLGYEGRRIALEQLAALKEGKIQRHEVILPIYVHLGAIAKELTESRHQNAQTAIVDILKRDHTLPDHFLYLLQQKLLGPRCLLLLDGLDEVSANYSLLVRAIKALVDRSECKILLTSRIAGYDRERVPFEFQGSERAKNELELISFDQEQIISFVKSWFAAKEMRNEDRLLAKINKEPILESQARIPLLLSFICSVFEQDEVFPTPLPRAKLYKKMLDKLLKASWRNEDQDEQKAREITTTAKMAVLEEVAWDFASGKDGWTDLMPPKRLRNILKDDTMLVALSEHAGVLVRAGEPSPNESLQEVPYLFLHRTLHEYLVAYHLSQEPFERCFDLIQPHLWFDPDWEIVLPLLAGLLEEPSKLLRFLVEERYDAFHMMLLLAGRCLVEVDRSTVEQEIVERIFKRLRRLLFSISHRDRVQAFQILRQLEDEQLTKTLLKTLSSRSWKTRYEALEMLEMLGDPSSVKGLLPALRTKNVDFCCKIASVLGKLRGTDAIDGLLILLRHKNENVRYVAIKQLQELGGPDAIEGIRTMLYDKRGNVTPEVAIALAQMGDQQEREIVTNILMKESKKNIIRAMTGLFPLAEQKFSARELTLLLQSKNSSASHNTAKLLQELDDKELDGQEALEGLVAALYHENTYISCEAVRTLGRCNDHNLVDALIVALQSEKISTRLAAITGLSLSSDPRAIDALLHALQDSNEQIVLATIQAYAQKGKLLEDIHQIALHHNNARVCITAAKTLGKHARSQVKEKLLIFLQDDDASIRTMAKDALTQLASEDQSLIHKLSMQLEHEKTDIKLIALETLWHMGVRDEKVVNMLVKLGHASSRSVQQTAAWLLMQLEDNQLVAEVAIQLIHNGNPYVCLYVPPKAVEVLKQRKDQRTINELICMLQDEKNILQDEDKWYTKYARSHVVDLLVQLGGEQILDSLIAATRFTQVEYKETRYDIIDALGKLGSQRAVPRLIMLLKSYDSDTQWHAANSLGELKDQRAVKGLLILLRNRDERVRDAAVTALANIGGKRAAEGLLKALRDSGGHADFEIETALSQLIQEGDPFNYGKDAVNFSRRILSLWLFISLDPSRCFIDNPFISGGLYENIIRIGPRLHEQVRDWSIWQECFVPLTHYMLEVERRPFSLSWLYKVQFILAALFLPHRWQVIFPHTILGGWVSLASQWMGALLFSIAAMLLIDKGLSSIGVHPIINIEVVIGYFLWIAVMHSWTILRRLLWLLVRFSFIWGLAGGIYYGLAFYLLHLPYWPSMIAWCLMLLAFVIIREKRRVL